MWFNIISRLETSLHRQLISLVLATKYKETKHCTHPKRKRQTEKTAIANKTNCAPVWYTFYDSWSGNGAGPVLTLQYGSLHVVILLCDGGICVCRCRCELLHHSMSARSQTRNFLCVCLDTLCHYATLMSWLHVT